MSAMNLSGVDCDLPLVKSLRRVINCPKTITTKTPAMPAPIAARTATASNAQSDSRMNVKILCRVDILISCVTLRRSYGFRAAASNVR